MDYAFLSGTRLFRGTAPQEIEAMLSCLAAREKHFAKNEVIYEAGEAVTSLGVVLAGSVTIENDDVWGNRSILDDARPGDVFAETYACVPGEPMMVRVVAAEPTDVLFLDTQHLLHMCARTCAYHAQLISNLLMISAQKNLNLSRRIFHTSSKSIRGRVLSYLSYQALRSGSRTFAIPFNRQQLADYLSVDRSALSNELGKMQKDGLLTVQKNRFTLFADEDAFPARESL